MGNTASARAPRKHRHEQSFGSPCRSPSQTLGQAARNRLLRRFQIHACAAKDTAWIDLRGVPAAVPVLTASGDGHCPKLEMTT